MKFFGSLMAVLVLAMGSGVSAGDKTLLEVGEYSVFTADGAHRMEIVFFAHNGPSIQEFLDGKNLVETEFNKISQYGFEPRVERLEIGIAPRTMQGGDIVVEGKKIYIYKAASPEAIQSALFSYFLAREGGITYFPHNGPSVEQFLNGIEKVQSAIDKFKLNGLELSLPEEFQVGVAPRTMQGGDLVESNEHLYIFFDVSDEQLERYFTQFIVTNPADSNLTFLH